MIFFLLKASSLINRLGQTHEDKGKETDSTQEIWYEIQLHVIYKHPDSQQRKEVKFEASVNVVLFTW